MLKELKDKVKEAVDKGATSIEEVQKEVAKMPFDIIGKMEPMKTTADGLHDLTDWSIGKVHDMIRGVNQKVSDYADVILRAEKDEKEKVKKGG